jgi:hypothetical protein
LATKKVAKKVVKKAAKKVASREYHRYSKKGADGTSGTGLRKNK